MPVELTPTDRAIIERGLTKIRRALILIDEINKESALIGSPQGKGADFFTDSIADACSNVGAASLFLFDDGSRTKKVETLGDIIGRKSRVGAIKSICRGIETSILEDRDIRNKLTHADEYIARLMSIHPKAAWMKSCVVQQRGLVLPAEGGMLLYDQVIILDENRLLHLGSEIDFVALRQVCAEVYNTLTRWLQDNPQRRDARGA